MIKSSSRFGHKIEWIVIHYTAAPGWSTTRLLDHYDSSKINESAHYAVDRKSSICIVSSKMCANHCRTSGLKTFCGAKNLNSLGIDLMDEKINTKSVSVDDSDWFIPEQTMNRAAALVGFLMKKYSIDIDHVVRHYDVTHKLCPRPFVGDDINQYYKTSGNEAWKRFKVMCVREAAALGDPTILQTSAK